MGMLAFPTGMRPALQIEARNRSDHPVRVASAGFNVQDNSGHVLAIFSDQPGATIPGVIPARDSGFTYLLPDQMEKLDPNRPVLRGYRCRPGSASTRSRSPCAARSGLAQAG